MQYGATLAAAEALGLDPAALRDYGGNDLGAAGGWQLAGLASVRNLSAPSYILVNPVNGRWAEVATQPDGSFNFASYGANGDTRIVGIYQDPLIALGMVTAGGPDDSQARFVSDIQANRLAVLGSLPDPNQSGFDDLLFKLTNHSADHSDDVYLRAILYPDGNIQYANYMNASQFTAWIAATGTPAAVYSHWLSQI